MTTQALWEEPAPGTQIRDGQRGHGSRLYTWLQCTQCRAGTWVRGGAPDQKRINDPEYFKSHGRPCLIPKCPGRHLLSEGPAQ